MHYSPYATRASTTPLNTTEIPKSEGYWYLCTPYSRFKLGMDAAARVAAFYTGRLLQLDVKVFSPIAHSHAITQVSYIDGTDTEYWLKIDRPFFDAAVGIIVLEMEGWKESRGIAREIEWAREADKPIVYISPETIDLIFDEAHSVTIAWREKCHN